MFNSHRKRRRRLDAAASRVRHARSRRLALESMESRLLLSGNQATGDLDYSIWNLDSLQSNYAIISQGNALPSPTTSTSNAGGPSANNRDSLTDTAPITPEFTIGNTPSLVTSLTSAGSSFGVYTTPIQYDIASSGLDDVRSTGDFNRDGLVNAADYQVWRDVLRPTDVLAYNNWRSHFGQSVAFLLNGDALGNDLALDRVGVLDSQESVTIDVAHTPENPASFGPITGLFEFALGNQDEAFAGGTPRAFHLNPSESLGDALPATNETTANLELFVNVGPITITTAKVADIATSGPTFVINIDGGSSQLVVSPAPKIGTPSARQSQDEAELDETIDELLTDDSIIVFHSGEGSGQMVADDKPAATTPADSTGATDVGLAEADPLNSNSSPVDSTESAKDAAEYQLAEGGMISIDAIVDAATSTATAAPSHTQIAAEGEATELVGELSRVAVMELIEGEAEPAAPQGFDFSALVAANDATESSDAVRIVTEQAGLAITLVSPIDPPYLASIASAASHAFAAVVNSELSGQLSDAARSEAFSEWGNEDADQLDYDQAAPTADHESNGWLDAAPLVVALACERTLAAKKKRRQLESDRHAVKAK